MGGRSLSLSQVVAVIPPLVFQTRAPLLDACGGELGVELERYLESQLSACQPGQPYRCAVDGVRTSFQCVDRQVAENVSHFGRWPLEFNVAGVEGTQDRGIYPEFLDMLDAEYVSREVRVSAGEREGAPQGERE